MYGQEREMWTGLSIHVIIVMLFLTLYVTFSRLQKWSLSKDSQVNRSVSVWLPLWHFRLVGTAVHVLTLYLHWTCTCMSFPSIIPSRVGRNSARLVRAAAMRLADELVELMTRPVHTIVTRVLEGWVGGEWMSGRGVDEWAGNESCIRLL